MDIRFSTGDITTVTEGVIVHGVNCQGKMNSGVAKTIRDKWPVVFDKYKQACDNHMNWPADLLGMVQPVKIDGEKLVVANLFSQENYGYGGERYANVPAIRHGIMQIAHSVNYADVLDEYKCVHLPKIGGTRGGLDFDKEVLPIIERAAAAFPAITFVIWEYDGTINK